LEQASVNQLYNPDRVLYPMKRVGARGDPVAAQQRWMDTVVKVSLRPTA